MGIDHYAYHSKISAVRTSDKLLFAVLPLIICLFADTNMISIIIIAVMCFSTVFCSGLNLKNFLLLMTIPFSFLILGTLTMIVCHVDGTKGVISSVSLFGSSFGITWRSLAKGLKLFLKSLAAVSCLYFFSLNTTMNSFFDFLRKTKCPTILIELMELMYRFIFVIGGEADRIYISQSSRLGYKNFKLSLRSLGALSTSIFLKSFGRVDRMNRALEARGFQGRFEFLLLEEKKCIWLRNSGILFSILLVILTVMVKVVR